MDPIGRVRAEPFPHIVPARYGRKVVFEDLDYYGLLVYPVCKLLPWIVKQWDFLFACASMVVKHLSCLLLLSGEVLSCGFCLMVKL